ncbi:MAG: hypothetical protein L3K08_05610 [Thermoplasmata archaeon]|nr:hypothetical protein [Thermoplasmata archaeon]
MEAIPPPSRGFRRSLRQRWWALALASILLAVLLVVAGEVYFPLRSTGRSAIGPGHDVGPDPRFASFLEDRYAADALERNLSGGPYLLVGGMAITRVGGTTLPLDASGASRCPLVPRPYTSLAAVRIPSVEDVTGGGLAPVWTFDYGGPNGVGVRIAVTDGKALALGAIVFSSPACPTDQRPSVNVSSPDDSSAIGLIALNLGGATFLSQNSNAEVTYSLAPGLEPGVHGEVAEEWNVTFDACGGGGPDVGVPTTLGESLTYVFDAGSGTLQTTASETYDCPEGANAPIPYALSQDLQVNAPVLSILGTTVVYDATIASACCGLTFGNLSLDLQLSGGAPIPSDAALTILNASGESLCELTGTELSGGTLACRAPVLMGDLISLTLPAGGNGSTNLVLEGKWDFTGSVIVPLADATQISPA